MKKANKFNNKRKNASIKTRERLPLDVLLLAAGDALNQGK